MATNFVKERVNELLISQSLSVRKLSEQIGVPQKTLNNQVNVSNPALLTLETILLILDACPYKCTTRIAFVLSVIFSSILEASIL